MTLYKISCKKCAYEVQLEDGPTKNMAREKDPYPGIFFCGSSKKFVSVMVNAVDTPKTKKVKDAAVPTEDLVAEKSRFRIHSHADCASGLIPIEYYRQEAKGTACPICGQGEIEIDPVRYKD